MNIFALPKWLYAIFMIMLGALLMIIVFPIVKRPKGPKFTAKFIQHTLFTPIEVQGEVDPNVQMFLVNHESDIDISTLENITTKDIAWVAKKELFDMPFFGHLLKLPNNIAVERESKTSLIKLLKDAKERLAEGRVITIFPEGTRSQNGKMRTFKPGAKMIADKHKLCVQPVVLINTSRYFNMKKKRFSSGTIQVVVLDSFIADKSDKEWLNNLRDRMQEVYNNEIEKLPKTA